jgi:ribonuclease J
MVRNMGIARDLGYLKVPGGLVVDVKTLDDLPDEDVVLICTGSQGEPMAALSRMANRDHQIRIVEGDTVILASSLIPGNENAVYRVINGLTRWGADVVHKGNAKVHVSGHASAGELLYFFNICKPRNLMPVHGEWRHLRAVSELGQKTGISKDHIVIAEDGVVIDLANGSAKIVGKVQAGYVYVDGLSVGDISEGSLKDRRILGEEGIISVFLVVDSNTGKITAGPNIQARGSGIDDDAFGPAIAKMQDALSRSAQDGVIEPRQVQQLVRRVLGKWVSDTYRRRPMILPVVVEV